MPERKTVIVLPASVQFALAKVQIVMMTLGVPELERLELHGEIQRAGGIDLDRQLLWRRRRTDPGDSAHATEKSARTAPGAA